MVDIGLEAHASFTQRHIATLEAFQIASARGEARNLWRGELRRAARVASTVKIDFARR